MISTEDYNAVRSGEKSPEQIQEERKEEERQEQIEQMSTKKFLTGLTDETTKVPVLTSGGEISIEIRSRLSKKEAKRFEPIFSKWQRVLKGEGVDFDDDDEKLIAEFLAYITTDAELDFAFWMSGDFDPQIEKDILFEYFTEPLRRKAKIEKFRRE